MSIEIQYKTLRKQLNMTQMELSAAIGEEVSRIWLLEQGFIHIVDPRAVERITRKLQDLCEKKELQELEML